MTPQIAALMADYNRWMNQRLHAAAATLDAAALAADRGAFFGSILGKCGLDAPDQFRRHFIENVRLRAHPRASARRWASIMPPSATMW